MSTTRTQKILGTAIIMAILTILAKALGLFRDILVAASYGMDNSSIAFTTASNIPITIFEFVISGVLTAAFIPVFNEILVKKDKETAFSFANSYITIIFLISVVVTIIGVVFSKSFVSLMADGLDDPTKELTSTLTKILFPMVIFNGIAYSTVGILQSFNEYKITAVLSLLANVIMVGYLLIFNTTFGIKGLAVAMLIGWATQALIQIPKLYKVGFRFKFKLDFKSPYIKKSLATALPILISSWTQPICNLINNRFASYIENGKAITALGYANKLYIVIVGIFTFITANLVFPNFSKSLSENDKNSTKELLKSSLKALLFIIIPISIGIIILSTPFISLVYERGNFTFADTLLTSDALRCYAIGMIFMALNEVINKLFFAAFNAKTPMINSIIAMACNIILVTCLYKPFGVKGIAISSSIAIAINCMINCVIAIKKGFLEIMKPDVIDILKIVASTFVMGIIVFMMFETHGGLNNIVSFISAFVLGVIVYFLTTYILKVDELKIVLNKISKK